MVQNRAEVNMSLLRSLPNLIASLFMAITPFLGAGLVENLLQLTDPAANIHLFSNPSMTLFSTLGNETVIFQLSC